jgi:hypothetical protein
MSKKFHPVYLLHILFILVLWGLVFFCMFRFPQSLASLTNRRMFYACVAAGVAAAGVAFVFLRLGALVQEPAVMFRRAVVGDALLAGALGILGPVFWMARDQTLFLCALLGALIILQTHVPLLDDEEFEPPGFQEHVPDPAREGQDEPHA